MRIHFQKKIVELIKYYIIPALVLCVILGGNSLGINNNNSATVIQLLNLVNRVNEYCYTIKNDDLNSRYDLLVSRFRKKFSRNQFIKLNGNIPINENNQSLGLSTRKNSGASSGLSFRNKHNMAGEYNVPTTFLGRRFDVQSNFIAYDIDKIRYIPDKYLAQVEVTYYFYITMPVPIPALGSNLENKKSGKYPPKKFTNIIHKSKNKITWELKQGQWFYVPQKTEFGLHVISGANPISWAPRQKTALTYTPGKLAGLFLATASGVSNGQVNISPAIHPELIKQAIYLDPVQSLRNIQNSLPGQYKVAKTFYLDRLKEYEEIVGKYYKIPAFWKRLSDMYLYFNQYEKALDALKSLRSLKPSDFNILTRISNIYLKIKEYQNALNSYLTYLDYRAITGETQVFNLERFLLFKPMGNTKVIPFKILKQGMFKQKKQKIFKLKKKVSSPYSPMKIAETAIYALRRGMVDDAYKLFSASYKFSPDYETVKNRINQLLNEKYSTFLIKDLVPQDLYPLFSKIHQYDLVLLLNRVFGAVDYPSMTIGKTGVKPVANIVVRSWGYFLDGTKILGDRSEIIINGTDFSPNKRGYNIVTMVPGKSMPKDILHIDPYIDKYPNEKLIQFIDDIPNGYIVMVSIRNDGFSNMKPSTFNHFKKLGGIGNPIKKFRASFVLIGIKGVNPGTALEKQASAPVTIAVLNYNSPVPVPACSSNLFKNIPGANNIKIELEGFQPGDRVKFSRYDNSKLYVFPRKDS